ncbi:MAG: hypothetical protein SGJ02_12140 [bacterium]|nr:hypothetical protein [bacterium]
MKTVIYLLKSRRFTSTLLGNDERTTEIQTGFELYILGERRLQ